MSLVDDELRAAWFRTRILVRLGGRTVDLDGVAEGSLAATVRPFQLPLTIITAWNPFGVARSRPHNRAANRRLWRELADAGYEPAVALGRAADGSWSEAGFAVGGQSEAQALLLARRWDQLAVFSVSELLVTVLTAADGASESRSRRRLPPRRLESPSGP